MTIKDGEITVYPGAVGTAQLLIEGEGNRKGLFELTVTENDYKFGHFVQTIGYDKFSSNAAVLATQGKAKATPGITGLDVIFEDLNETFFVVKAANSYKVVKTQAQVTGNSFAATEPTIYDALVVTGEVTNVKGLHTVEDDGKTIIFADATTTFPASYTLDGVIYEVTAGTSPAQLTSTALTETATNITAATFMQGTNVVAFTSGNWTAKAEGTGIYKVTVGTETEYIEVTVAANTNSYTINEPKQLVKRTSASLSELKVLAPTENVYVDEENKTIYGETTETIVISAIENGKKVVYTGNFADGFKNDFTGFSVAKTTVLDALEWNTFKEHSLNDASTIMRIDGTDVYALAPGEELITFKSPNGLERTLKVIVNADYTFTITAETPHTLTYSADAGENGDEIVFTFTLNIPENVTGLTITPPSNNSDASVLGTKLKVIIPQGTPITSTFEIVFPELEDTTAQPIKVVTKDITDYTIADTIDNDGNTKFRFNLVQP